MLFHSLFIIYMFLAVLCQANDWKNPRSETSSTAKFSNNTGPWAIGSTQTLNWDTNYESYVVTFWQYNFTEGARTIPAGIVFNKQRQDPPIGKFDWQVQLYGYDLADSNVFRFNVLPLYSDLVGKVPHAFNFFSGYVNITAENIPAGSAPIPISTRATGAGSALSTSASSSSVVPVQSTPSSGAPSSSKRSPGLTIYLGIGISCGAIILGLVAALLYLLYIIRRRQAKTGPKESEDMPQTPMSESRYPELGGGRPAELEAPLHEAELGASKENELKILAKHELPGFI